MNFIYTATHSERNTR